MVQHFKVFQDVWHSSLWRVIAATGDESWLRGKGTSCSRKEEANVAKWGFTVSGKSQLDSNFFTRSSPSFRVNFNHCTMHNIQSNPKMPNIYATSNWRPFTRHDFVLRGLRMLSRPPDPPSSDCVSHWIVC